MADLDRLSESEREWFSNVARAACRGGGVLRSNFSSD